jgi:hypothetical protein
VPCAKSRLAFSKRTIRAKRFGERLTCSHNWEQSRARLHPLSAANSVIASHGFVWSFSQWTDNASRWPPLVTPSPPTGASVLTGRTGVLRVVSRGRR